jgi:nicotinate-nucleotide adenylyltransferase
VLLVPAHTAPYKAGGEEAGHDPGPEQRLRMCELAADAADGWIGVCPLEIERGGVSYTVDTLRELHARYPQAELTLIVGADVASTLGGWREPRELLALARLAIAARPGVGEPPAPPALPAAPSAEREQELPAELVAPERVSVLRMPAVDVSSSMVRARVARGEPVGELVGEAVAGYIAERGLYLLAAGARA